MRTLTALYLVSLAVIAGCSAPQKPVVKYQSVILTLSRDTVLERQLAAAVELAQTTCAHKPACGTAEECDALVAHQSRMAHEIYSGTSADQVESRKRFLGRCYDHYVKQYAILRELEPLRAKYKR